MTLLPALLSLAGARLDACGCCRSGSLERRASRERGFWPRLARTIMRRPVLFAVGSTAFLLAAAAPAAHLELGPGSNQGIPRDLRVRPGPRRPHRRRRRGRDRADGRSSSTRARRRRRRPRGAQAVAAARAARWRTTRRSRASVRARRRSARRPTRPLPATSRSSASSDYGKPESARVRRPAARASSCRRPASRPGARVYAGGGPPGGKDFLDLTYSWFPWLVLARAARHVRAAAAGVPLAAPAAQGDPAQPALDRRRLRPARRGLQVGLGRAGSV